MVVPELPQSSGRRGAEAAQPRPSIVTSGGFAVAGGAVRATLTPSALEAGQRRRQSAPGA